MGKTKTVWVYVNAEGEKKRMTIGDSSEVWEGSIEIGTGVTLEALYFSKKSKRLIAETYSCWESKRGGCVGTQYTLLESPEEIQQYTDYLPQRILDELVEAEEF